MTSNLRNLLYLLALVCVLGVAFIFAKPRTGIEGYLVQRSFERAIADYAERNVAATLSRLVEELELLEGAARRLRAEPTDSNLKAAASAWRTARATAQYTNAFGFGPAAHYNFDKQLATWPIDRPLIEHTLSEMQGGRLDLDARHLRERMYSTRRGLLAAEYLLFRDGRPRRASDLRPAELDYLAVTTEVLRLEATDFLAAWVGTDNLSPERADALAVAGFEPRSSYAAEFTQPGDYSSRYPSPSVALQEIMGDAAMVAEELCPAIEEVLGSDDPRAGETWDSRNGAADLLANLQGLENAYLGGLEGVRGHSMSDLLAEMDPVFDRRIRIALADTAYRIEAAGDPFAEDPSEDRELAVRRAVSACEKLFTRLEIAAPFVTMHPATLPWAAYGVYEATAPVLARGIR